MFSLETRKLISSLVRLHIDYEKALENQRELIVNKLQIDLDAIYSNLDLDRDGVLEFYEVNKRKKNKKTEFKSIFENFITKKNS